MALQKLFLRALIFALTHSSRRKLSNTMQINDRRLLVSGLRQWERVTFTLKVLRTAPKTWGANRCFTHGLIAKRYN